MWNNEELSDPLWWVSWRCNSSQFFAHPKGAVKNTNGSSYFTGCKKKRLSLHLTHVICKISRSSAPVRSLISRLIVTHCSVHLMCRITACVAWCDTAQHRNRCRKTVWISSRKKTFTEKVGVSGSTLINSGTFYDQGKEFFWSHRGSRRTHTECVLHSELFEDFWQCRLPSFHQRVNLYGAHDGEIGGCCSASWVGGLGYLQWRCLNNVSCPVSLSHRQLKESQRHAAAEGVKIKSSRFPLVFSQLSSSLNSRILSLQSQPAQDPLHADCWFSRYVCAIQRACSGGENNEYTLEE